MVNGVGVMSMTRCEKKGEDGPIKLLKMCRQATIVLAREVGQGQILVTTKSSYVSQS